MKLIQANACLLIMTLLLMSCDETTQRQTIDPVTESKLAIVPQAKNISTYDQVLVLSKESKIYGSTAKLEPLIDLFAEELKTISGIKLETSLAQDKHSDILFQIDDSMSGEEYQITINDVVELKAGNYPALAQGRNTLLQLARSSDDHVKFPAVTILDAPDSEYRGLLIDLARNWHSVDSIKQLIDLASYYKTNYVQLHFTDYQSYTLPSIAYPKLPTPGRSYTADEIRDLDRYAAKRGVTLIPELEVPGHAGSMIESYPELFGIADFDKNPWIINMGKEEVYAALEVIFGELIDLFPNAPYIHIGGDEAIFNEVMNDPDVQNFIEEKGLENDVHEVYRHFLIRMNDMIRARGKTMALWEGFTREGKIQIPKNVVVFEFETNRYLPQDLIEDGYTVVNTSWKPLYVVNQKKWEPKSIYNWNIWRWENWYPKAPSIVPIQLNETPLIIGAQMCAWEQPEEVEFPSLRKRLPVMNERIWNTKDNPSFDQFYDNMSRTDDILSLLVNDERQDSVLIGHNFKAEDEN